MILLVLVVLLTGEVWAGEFNKSFRIGDETKTILSITNWADCESGKEKCIVYTNPLYVKDPLPDPCLAQMEAAMRAMEAAIPGDGWNQYGETSAMIRKMPPGGMEQVGAALKLWSDTKAQCWRK